MNKSQKHMTRCWEYFHCMPQARASCLMSEAEEWKCWTVNISCCKMDKDTPRPLSVKHVICKTCEYYKAYSKPE